MNEFATEVCKQTGGDDNQDKYAQSLRSGDDARRDEVKGLVSQASGVVDPKDESVEEDRVMIPKVGTYKVLEQVNVSAVMDDVKEKFGMETVEVVKSMEWIVNAKDDKKVDEQWQIDNTVCVDMVQHGADDESADSSREIIEFDVKRNSVMEATIEKSVVQKVYEDFKIVHFMKVDFEKFRVKDKLSVKHQSVQDLVDVGKDVAIVDETVKEVEIVEDTLVSSSN